MPIAVQLAAASFFLALQTVYEWLLRVFKRTAGTGGTTKKPTLKQRSSINPSNSSAILLISADVVVLVSESIKNITEPLSPDKPDGMSGSDIGSCFSGLCIEPLRLAGPSPRTSCSRRTHRSRSSSFATRTVRAFGDSDGAATCKLKSARERVGNPVEPANSKWPGS